MKLKALVDSIPDAASHDWIFVNSIDPSKALSPSTIANKATEILNKWTNAVAGRPTYTSHTFRKIAVNTLKAKGVPEQQIKSRGTLGGASNVLELIYSSRVVPTNFSNKILMDFEPNSQF